MKIIKETYKNKKTKCKVICEKGHVTLIIPKNVENKKCKICFGSTMYHEDEFYRSFMYRSPLVHNNKYDYSLVKISKLLKSTDKVIINCPIHGQFKQRICDHLSGRGCKKCGNSNKNKNTRISEKVFLEKLKISKPHIKLNEGYLQFSKPAIFKCIIHDYVFKSTPILQLNNNVSSCKYCLRKQRSRASKGFYNLRNAIDGKFKYEGYLYIIKIKEIITNKIYLKIGVSTNTKRRFNQIKNNGLEIFDIKIVKDLNLTFSVLTEHLLKVKFKNDRYFPNLKFNGMYECYNIKSYEKILSFISHRHSANDIMQI